MDLRPASMAGLGVLHSEPLTTLARRFGSSDDGLRKRCTAMDLPTPRQECREI